MTSSEQVEDVKFALQLLAAPRGGEPGAVAARDEAMRILLAAPDIAHPQLMAMATGSHPPPLILLALARFGRMESLPLLQSAFLSGDAPTAVMAAQALAQHPSAAARQMLEEALQGHSDQLALAAAHGLAQQAEPASIPALRRAIDQWPEGEIRDAIQAALAALE
jgi:hypothetical protein